MINQEIFHQQAAEGKLIVNYELIPLKFNPKAWFKGSSSGYGQPISKKWLTPLSTYSLSTSLSPAITDRFLHRTIRSSVWIALLKVRSYSAPHSNTHQATLEPGQQLN